MSGKLVRLKNESCLGVLRTALGGTFSDARIVEIALQSLLSSIGADPNENRVISEARILEIANKQVSESIDRIMDKVGHHFGIEFTVDSGKNELRIRGMDAGGRRKKAVVSWSGSTREDIVEFEN